MDKSDEQKTERFNMFMSPSEMKAIDDWAWENKVRSKSEAVRRLIQIGLRADRHISLLGEAVYRASEAVKGFDATWSALMADFVDDKIDRQTFANNAVKAVHDLLPAVKRGAFDAHDRFTDFGLEFNALARAVTVEDAIAAGDKEAAEAKERWEKWLQDEGEEQKK